MATRIAVGSAAKAARWRLSTAGHFALVGSGSGKDATPPTRKARAILAFLCSHPGQRFTREQIAALLWGDRGEAQARASLRQALLEIRQATAAGPPVLQADRTDIWAEPASLEPDALDQTGWARSDELLFDDLNHISAEFDEWLALARAERSRRLGGALRAEVEKLLERGRGAAALALSERLQRLDPFDEDALRLALRAEYQGGRAAGIERRVREMDSRLQEELGVTISNESKALRDELVEALSSPRVAPRTLREVEPPRDRTVAEPRLVPRKPRQPWLLIAAAMLLLLAIGALGVRTLRTAPQPAPKMLAVLPFNASHGADGDFAEGLSDELISQLAQNRDLRVIGRTSAWQYKGKAVDLRTIGRQLGVDYLVEGDVSKAGDQVRVAVSLIRARDGTAMWSRIYRASVQQSPLIRGAIGSALVGALGIPEQAFAAGYKPNGEAYALYLKAKALFRQRTDPSMESARTLMLEAIRIDQNFAPPWAYAGGITASLGEDRFLLDPTRPKGPSMTPRQALEHALKLDPNLADAHGFMGWVAGPYNAEGYRHALRAVELKPNDSQLLLWYSLALYRYGDYARYSEVARKAAALDPFWQRPVETAASASLWAGDSKAVQRYIDRIRTADPGAALEVESAIAAQSGDFSRSIEIALGNKGRPFQLSSEQASSNLIALGFEREGRLVGNLGPEGALYDSQNVPDRATMLKLGPLDYGAAFYQLRMHGRYSDAAALYDASGGAFVLYGKPAKGASIRQATYFNRRLRSYFGGVVAQALLKVGRKGEAQQLLRLADDADKALMASGSMPPQDLFIVAANEAVAGRRDEAIAHMLQAASKGFYLDVPVNGNIDPIWENVRGDPRFERLARVALNHWRSERREVLAMHLF